MHLVQKKRKKRFSNLELSIWHNPDPEKVILLTIVIYVNHPVLNIFTAFTEHFYILRSFSYAICFEHIFILETYIVGNYNVNQKVYIHITLTMEKITRKLRSILLRAGG